MTQVEESPLQTYILFEIAGTTYAIPTTLVRQMEMIENITPVPNAPLFVEGVVFSRGQVIPAINLRLRFGLEKIKHNTGTRLIVTQIGNRTCGLIADTAREFISIPDSAIQPPPDTIKEATNRYISGIAFLKGRTLLILDPQQIINMENTT
ncbi:chemotaxis protein CheW [Ancylothrix sp. C2]|uniref:chemotaxis protein CheW n=1 Tax=Ancylothrix sp. D3o TaxID=2953691 RepID=UPI0021BA8A8F|nr:chemotaxis protein CheW [Ancylothrix sp. D3o]MCT7952559.1 chemotaxis protein CheW [Ancylothrix sp. D3o]